MSPLVSVLMPTYDQEAFLPRAVSGLLAQSTPDWELVVIDDGSPGDVPAALTPFPGERIRYRRLPTNRGLGAALNEGLDTARGAFIAYLPSDDVYHPDHLESLLAALRGGGAGLAYSGIRPHQDPDGLRLVQVMHRAGPRRWITREELESDDLERLFFARCCPPAERVTTGLVTCTWTDHPGQRHKAIRERDGGGVNVFRRRYRVTRPLRLHSRDSGLVDEVGLYRRFRERPLAADPDGLKILLVGELAYNPERVLALAERGARLFGLWTPDGLGYNAVGPLPFGHVTDLPVDWRHAIRRSRPDVIYAQLDWRAVPFAAHVLEHTPDVPFVWHFKESPQRSIARGEWPLLAALCRDADAVLLSSPEERDWFLRALPGHLDLASAGVLDGSLPKADWLGGDPASRLSDDLSARLGDGRVHSVLLGRPLGLDPPFVAELAAGGVHLHCHGPRDTPEEDWRRWLADVHAAAPGAVHLHPAVDQRGWVSVLSRYDAGWLHRFRSDNGGDILAATWDDLNYPARLGTLMAAGLPVLQPRADRSICAMDRLVAREGIGLRYRGAGDLVAQLSQLPRIRDRVAAVRHRFTFDHHVSRLLDLFAGLAGRPTRRSKRCG